MSETPKPLVLDHIEKLEIPNPRDFATELRSLQYMAVGLDFLYDQVKQWEARAPRHTPYGKVAFAFGDIPQFSDLPLDLISCFFHWYSVSAYNYAGLVGWIAETAEVSSRSPGEYARMVIPREVLVFRRKVGAHLARAWPLDKEEPAVSQASVFYPLGFDGERFIATPFVVRFTWEGGGSSSEEMQRWSLTKVHEHLRARYWPDRGLG